MNVADLLTPDRIVISMRSDSVQEAMEVLEDRVVPTGSTVATQAASESESDEAEPASGPELRRLGDDLLLMGVRREGVDDLAMALGITATPLDGEQLGSPGPVRGLFFLVSPRDPGSLSGPGDQLESYFQDGERRKELLACQTTGQVRALREFMELELHPTLKVEDVLTPVTYRIYPNTPLDEVVDLMVRKNLQAVPVVGEKYEVLGMVTAAEALRYTLSHRKTGEGDGAEKAEKAQVMARDVMSRSVMCVAEDESLLDAAGLMVNKGVAQLPVVREGEIIGLLTRDRVLRALTP